ncbi:MAG TPA: ABC-2 family transporter protein [Polyangiaceae bacterium]
MSVRATVRAFPTLLRTGFADAVAYRAEMIVWILATTMPLVMLALWTAVAQNQPIGRYGQAQFVAYFLATFIVRQLASSWAFYEMNFEVRNGTLAMRMLRPVHPLWAYAAESLASMPFRALVSVPFAIVALAVVGRDAVTHDPGAWALWAVSILGAWLITLSVNLVIGCFAFFMESSMKLMDAWLVFFFVLSGYLIPIELFPGRLRAIVDWLPFRYQIGLPVEIMTGVHTSYAEILQLLARQWGWVVLGLGATYLAWRRGLRQFAAYGG